ncbi:MAG: M23 family metallopeptidase [Spirochaetales bacterium]
MVAVRNLVLIGIVLLTISSFLIAQEQVPIARYPIIQELNVRDPVFKQYIQEVNENYRRLANREEPSVSIYSYQAREDDDLLAIAARCNILYDSVALLNTVAFIDSIIVGKTLLLPTVSGIFIPETPVTPLEFLLKIGYLVEDYVRYTINGKHFYFVPNGRLTPTERSFFLDSSMIAPLETGIISSSFGMRESPFTGDPSFHEGTDIAAPLGTPVFACKAGVVIYSGYNYVYGNYVILQHESNVQSLYAHLDTSLVHTGDISERGEQIGTVGTTGMSTGSHLHFEIKVGGQAQDPSALIKNFMQ